MKWSKNLFSQGKRRDQSHTLMAQHEINPTSEYLWDLQSIVDYPWLTVILTINSYSVDTPAIPWLALKRQLIKILVHSQLIFDQYTWVGTCKYLAKYLSSVIENQSRCPSQVDQHLTAGPFSTPDLTYAP